MTSLKNAKRLSVSITFGRRLLGTILAVHLSTVLLNSIILATNFFKPFFFGAVITVNLTAILVLKTMFITYRAKNFVRQDDRRLIFNLHLLFIEVLVGSRRLGLQSSRPFLSTRTWTPSGRVAHPAGALEPGCEEMERE